MAQKKKTDPPALLVKFNADFASAQKDFDAAYAQLRRFLDKIKLNALRKNLGKTK